MSTLKFKAADVRRVAEHAKANAPRIVYLVKDWGVYLMSGGEPRDTVVVAGKKQNFCAYAEGTNPEKFPDTYYDTQQALCGGDDFGEQLGPHWIDGLLLAAKAPARVVRIKLSKNRVELMRSKA